MASGFVIMFAPDTDRPANYYWDGANQIGISAGETPDGAKFFANKAEARVEAGKLQQSYPNQQVAVVSSQLQITPTYVSTPDIIAPVAAPVAAPAAAPAAVPAA